MSSFVSDLLLVLGSHICILKIIVKDKLILLVLALDAWPSVLPAYIKSL